MPSNILNVSTFSYALVLYTTGILSPLFLAFSIAFIIGIVKEGYVEEQIMKRGVIVRHLLLPACVKDSKAVIKYLYDTYKDDIYISIMNQYTPINRIKEYDNLNRRVTKKEYDEVVDYAIELGVVNGFIQEGGTADESFIPEFDYTGLL